MTCFTKALQQFMQTCFDHNYMFNVILKWTSDLMWYDKIKLKIHFLSTRCQCLIDTVEFDSATTGYY